jgi:TPR repeat protein
MTEDLFCYYYDQAMKGYKNYQYQLGYNYRYGIGIKKNLKKSLYWFKRAALQKDIHSLRYIFYIYSNHEEIDRNDVNKALYWCKMYDNCYSEKNNISSYLLFP